MSQTRQQYRSPGKIKIILNEKFPNHTILRNKQPINTKNHENVYQSYLRYCSSMQQKPNLDHKDHKLIIPFEEKLTYEEKQFAKSGTILQQDQWKIRQWLIAVIQLINSDSFRKYNENVLSLDEIKAYASQNLLLNFHLFMQKLDQFSLDKQYRVKVLNFIDQESLQIVKFAKLKYPQNSSSSSFRRFQKEVSHRDNSQEQQFGLLQAAKNDQSERQKLQFTYQPFEQNYDYKQTIMQVINYLIKLPTKKFDADQDQITKYQAFQMMVNALFKSPTKVKKKLQNLGSPAKKFRKDKNMSPSAQQNEKSEKSQNFQKESQEKVNQIILQIMKSQFLVLSTQKGFKQFFSKIQQEKSQKNDSKISFSVNRKIPDYVKPFTEDQIETGDFKLKHSSILRIMTKWVQQLQQNIDNVDEFINRRVTDNAKQQTLGYDPDFKKHQSDIKQKINQQVSSIEENRQKYKKHLTQIREQIFSSQFLGKYLNSLDTNVGIIAGRVQLCLSEYILRQLNDLIHCFLKSVQDHKYLDLSLITLKLGDLMRAKISADQDHIIRVHEAMQEMSNKCPQIFQLIQVKNRLEKKDKDVLITFMFLKQIICEIQLSVKSESDEKNKKLNQFNHFLYELERAEFGVIAEASCIAAKSNPIFQKQFQRIESQSKLKVKHPKTVQAEIQVRQQKSSNQSFDLSNSHSKYKHQQSDTLPFICQSQTCHELQKKEKKILNALFRCEYFAALIKENPKTCRKCIFKKIIPSAQEHQKISESMLCLSLQNTNSTSLKEVSQAQQEIKKYLIKQHFKLVIKKQSIQLNQFGMLIKKTDHLLKYYFYKFFRYGNQIFLYSVDMEGKFLKNNLIIFEVFTIKKRIQKSLKKSKYFKKDLQKYQQKMSKYYFFQAQITKCIQEKNDEIRVKCKCKDQNMPPIKLCERVDQDLIKQSDNFHYFQKIKIQKKTRLNLIDRELNQDVMDQKNVKKIQYLLDVRKVFADNKTKDLFQNSDFPERIKYTQYLHLNECEIRQLDFLNLMQSLWYLNLSKNKITSFQGVKLKQLRQLYADGNQLTEIPMQFPNLTILRMSESAQLRRVSLLKSNKLQKLTKLSLHGCFNLVLFQADQASLPELKKLYLSNCTELISINLNGMFENIQLINLNKCLKLEKLDLKNCRNLQQIFCLQNQSLEQFKISENKQLKQLHLSRAKKAKIQLDFTKHSKVKQVKITDSKLNSSHIKGIKSAEQTLQCLNLQNNEISEWNQILNLYELKTLVLQGNSLQGQLNCKDFKYLHRLIQLNVSQTNLNSIFGLEYCNFLEKLVLFPRQRQNSSFDILKLSEKSLFKLNDLRCAQLRNQINLHKKMKSQKVTTHYFEFPYKDQRKGIKKPPTIGTFYISKSCYIPKIRLDKHIGIIPLEGVCQQCKKASKLFVCLSCTFKTQGNCPIFDQQESKKIHITSYCLSCIKKMMNETTQKQKLYRKVSKQLSDKKIEHCSCHSFFSKYIQQSE